MVMEGAEKQAGRLWDKFGMKVVKEKRDTLYVGVGHRDKAMACVCHTSYGSWKATSPLPSVFEWWNTTCARRKTFSIVSVAARRARVRHAFERKQLFVFVTFGVFEVCNTAARRKAAFVDLEE